MEWNKPRPLTKIIGIQSDDFAILLCVYNFYVRKYHSAYSFSQQRKQRK